ncbi:MAG: NADH-quinone oxidoreductase subunit NuoF [Clostridiales bacterium]|jgi:NADH-quinone oxidoreductase subunit F|nr:NADH-quinone oxidoreductase subunit NuoF [Eubacteriales bacterium]MDH7565433.1 NADH-quinone oxidoreductase subunit NuoF [Clostridiales bacterium]
MDGKLAVRRAEDLENIKNQYLSENSRYQYRVLVCSGAGCISSNCHAVKDALVKALQDSNLCDRVSVSETGCIGDCNLGPAMVVLPEGVLYTKLDPKDVGPIVDSHFLKGRIRMENTYYDIPKEKHIPFLKDIDYFKNQVKIALRNCGRIDYASLEEYIANDGYKSIARVLQDMTPAEVVKEIKKSGLRGRGGGGFPTGVKWEEGMKSEGDVKYIVCNADEGDPGAYMDRSILEGDPHSIIEGMMIGAYAIGASKGYVYIRAEYPLAVERLDTAIKKAREAGLLGENILESGFNFELEIRIGEGAFVCGEETALIASIEGKRGEPEQKPPYPSQKGLYGKPTVINNVETFANIPPIILKGSEWFTQYGTQGSKGTKVFALAGSVNNAGIVEVPMGITVGDIVFNIGGGIKKNKQFKALQSGGPSGGCVTKDHLNTPIDYDSLVKLGSIMGSGGLIALDEDTCMVDMAKYFMEFVQEESCGKCVPCRVGTKRMLEILERITKGEGQNGDIELLQEIGQMIKETSVCGLGQTAPNPVLSTIKSFREEYEEHIKYKHCRAGVCENMFISPCQNACPAGVNVPGYIALIAAGRLRDAYNLIRKENPFPAVCGRVCTHPCESKCRRAQLDDPIAISDLKRYVTDYVFKNEEPYMDLVFPKKGISVGIIGAGPSGLTCGYYLARLGYDVEVYEAHQVAGGVLAFGIPEFRLPKDILQHEIKLIERVGVKIHLNTEVGTDITFYQLRNKHAAIYIATGTQFPHKINIPGEELKEVYYGMDFLRYVSLGKKPKVTGTVAVIGGGNTAVDAARTALRLGAKKVYILYRRLIEDMPADARDVREAIEEGIEILPLVTPLRFLGKDRVTGVECIRMEFGEFDSTGRRKPKPIHGTEFTIKVDAVIPAISLYSDLPFINKNEVEVTQWGTFVADNDTLMTKMKGVFAGGDVIRGSDVVISAIADGKKAAKSIDKYLGGNGILNTGEDIEIPEPSDEREVMEHERFPMRYLDPETRKSSFDEVAVGFYKLNAVEEAMRCLRCDRRA